MLVVEEEFRLQKAKLSNHFNLRIHRSISWLKKSMNLDQELDFKFISLWIAFNAIFVQELSHEQDKQSLRIFLKKIYRFDDQHRIFTVIWEKNNYLIQSHLKVTSLFNAFWNYQNQKINKQVWLAEKEREQINVELALQNKDTVEILFIIFTRLYSLNDQIMCGGATYNSSMNRKLIEDICNILSIFMPIFIAIILNNADTFDSEKPFYPAFHAS